jgi:hypothetical protein
MKLSTLLSALVLCLVVAISCVVEAASGSFPVSFKPSKPPKWSREEQAHIAQLFPNGIRSEPQKGTLKYVIYTSRLWLEGILNINCIS